jgi:hypothetical protein
MGLLLETVINKAVGGRPEPARVAIEERGGGGTHPRVWKQ